MDTACNTCGAPLSGSDVLYAEDGSIICQACQDVRDVRRDEGNAARNILGATGTSVVAAIVSFVFNPLFAATIVAIASGSYAMTSLRPGNERITRHLSRGQRTLVLLGGGLGIALAVLPLLIFSALLAGHT